MNLSENRKPRSTAPSMSNFEQAEQGDVEVEEPQAAARQAGLGEDVIDFLFGGGQAGALPGTGGNDGAGGPGAIGDAGTAAFEGGGDEIPAEGIPTPEPIEDVTELEGAHQVGSGESGWIDRILGAAGETALNTGQGALQLWLQEQLGTDDASRLEGLYDKLYPGTTPWERLGSQGATGAGLASGTQQMANQSQMQNALRIAREGNTAGIITGLSQYGPGAVKAGLNEYKGEQGLDAQSWLGEAQMLAKQQPGIIGNLNADFQVKMVQTILTELQTAHEAGKMDLTNMLEHVQNATIQKLYKEIEILTHEEEEAEVSAEQAEERGKAEIRSLSMKQWQQAIGPATADFINLIYQTLGIPGKPGSAVE